MTTERGRRRPGESRGPQRLSVALDRLMGTMRAPRVDVLDHVFNRWDEIVGGDVAAHVRPVSIDGDRLLVSADDAAWASEFRWLEREVLGRLAEATGSDRITQVTVRVGPR